jgi:hypothetical protein
MKNLIFALLICTSFFVGYFSAPKQIETQSEKLVLIDNPTDSDVEFDDLTPIGAKCEATTKKGKKCSRKAKNGLFCKQHVK